MTPELKYKIKRCGTLLAQSPLDEVIKNTVVENVSNMTEDQLDQIIRSLERETIELVSLTKILEDFDKQQNESWKEVEKKQQEKAGTILEKTLKDLETV